MKFYTSVKKKGNKILVRGYEDGFRFQEEIKYKPYLFVRTSEETEFHTIFGEPVGKITFDSCSEAYEYRKKYDGVYGHAIYGMTNYEYVYIYDTYPENFEYDYDLISVVNIDIETDSSNGFGNIELADREITAITMTKNGKVICFGFFDYEPKHPEAIYVQCKDERELLLKFIQIWNSDFWNPDILTGWNSEFFDLPVIIRRIVQVLGKKFAEKLSTFGNIYEKEVIWKNGKTFKSFEIGGITHIDYLAAYKKFAMGERESYKLSFIADYEDLDVKKLDYVSLGYKSLNDLYKRNFSLFMDYNINDALILEKLEAKVHFIQQIVTIAYVQRVNYEVTLGTVKPWDIMIHNYLMDQKLVVPAMEVEDGQDIMGGYVKQPAVGMYEWLCSIDFTSLYPSLALQYNTSPDTLVGRNMETPSLDEIISGDISAFTKELKEKDLCASINGCRYRRDKRGFFPTILKKFFDGRKVYKKTLIEKKNLLKADPTNINLINETTKYDNLQNAYKLIGNSGYGALLNEYFRWFDGDIGESITASGQLTTQYIVVKLNEHLNKLFKTEGRDFVVYCDTDSAYIDLSYVVQKMGWTDPMDITKRLVKVMEDHVVKFVNDICIKLADSLNCYEVATMVKLEKICPKVIFTGKKRYLLNYYFDEGVYYDNPKRKVTGLETVRSSVPKYAREALKKSYDIILYGTQDDLYKFIEDTREDFNKQPFEVVANPSGVKGLNQYFDPQTLYKGGTPFHVRASLVFNQEVRKRKLTDAYELIQNFDKIKYCYLNMPNPFHENVFAIKDVAPKEFDLDSFIDYDRQFEKVFLKPLESVANARGMNVKHIDTLEDVFG